MDAEDEKFLQSILDESKKHGHSTVDVEYRDNVIEVIKETRIYKRGKHFARCNPKVNSH